MALSFLDRLERGPILCDGAMGTLLYGKGVFINRCYDELNVSQPDFIRAIHMDYLNNGAEIIETNTFGGNSFRLGKFGCGDRVHEINLAGARLAKECVHKKGDSAFVAGSIGPIGVRMEPLGKVSRDEVRESFRA